MKELNDPNQLAELREMYPDHVINACFMGGGFQMDGVSYSRCENCSKHYPCENKVERWMCDSCWFSFNGLPDIREAREYAENVAWLQENALRKSILQQAEARR